MERLLTVREVAGLLSLSVAQVYALSKSRYKARHGEGIPVIKINGNLRYRASDIEAWVERLANKEAA